MARSKYLDQKVYHAYHSCEVKKLKVTEHFRKIFCLHIMESVPAANFPEQSSVVPFFRKTS
jgi:hypothetical protein